MAGAATLTQAANPQGRQNAPQPMVPFVRASTRQTIPGQIDQSRQMTANAQQVGVFELPASGFLRSVVLLVTATGGSGGSGVLDADGPFSVIDQISLEDPSGRPIYGPISGYEMYLSNLYGGYEFQVDPTTFNAYDVSDAANGNFSFLLRIPVEASVRDAYASLVNQDSSAAYRVRISMSGEGAVFSTSPVTTLPSVRFQGWVELWTQPTATNLQGQPQQQTPPGLGTIQAWTRETNTLNSGDNGIRVKRVGNLFRNLVLITRDSSGDRVADSVLPDPIRVDWDSLTLKNEGRSLLLTKMENEYGVANPQGVLVYTFCDDLDGKPGAEMRNALLPTTPATRLEFNGSWGGAGSLTVMINDIAPVNLG